MRPGRGPFAPVEPPWASEALYMALGALPGGAIGLLVRLLALTLTFLRFRRTI